MEAVVLPFGFYVSDPACLELIVERINRNIRFPGRCTAVHALGVGVKPIMRKKLTADKLADSIREVTTNRAIGQKARALGERLGREDGIARAIAIIEGLV